MNNYCISALAFLMFISTMSYGQNTVQYYDVIHNDKIVGSTIVKKTGSDQNFVITLNFSADITFLIKRVVILGKEHALFENGVLKSGSVFRQANDKIKTDNSIKYLGNSYTVHDGHQSHALPIGEIRNNMLSLFFSEPRKLTSIYSDSQQKLVNLKEVTPHRYVIPGNNESSSTYIFQNGQCSRIILKSDLLSIQLVRK
ncbi:MULTISPECIES: DUF6134 family protein [Chryseobacterium]|uniref:DUF3108 domain-containing protein n=1 Tax=Chryseobacterium camelliae TaxID=1265445 RepID=A0ABU0TGH6_9FLAO|nr:MULTISPECIES: DUF6134 family protein [Chryseobacterium]MDT3406969.1 hypothetical protein [Pseudacidovorax intermedius]MDQ1095238.1 hypothetical protein [Chryseobacterium camelliae]MDQ1099176.1 hypothetical protein [Chryseobacterium sp. SORGH_AS_1048]MDR6086525.1 hypothetical protein [Chryseobacterium sp. SORGH_AS_0909]MDR6130896.1 hypothetical protein [Chryseobacterium sp. SORGH_AS_1175]